MVTLLLSLHEPLAKFKWSTWSWSAREAVIRLASNLPLARRTYPPKVPDLASALKFQDGQKSVHNQHCFVTNDSSAPPSYLVVNRRNLVLQVQEPRISLRALIEQIPFFATIPKSIEQTNTFHAAEPTVFGTCRFHRNISWSLPFHRLTWLESSFNKARCRFMRFLIEIKVGRVECVFMWDI